MDNMGFQEGDAPNPAETCRTPLYDTHLRLGGRMVEYAGWLLPVQYTGLVAEHQAVRTGAGLFDVSHMGEIAVEGTDALAFLDRMVTNRLTDMQVGQAVYSPMCAEDGGTRDDLLVYRRGDCAFLLIVNAANRKTDFQWLSGVAASGGPSVAPGMLVSVSDVSDGYGLIALQGPAAEGILRNVAGDAPCTLGYYRFMEGVAIAGADCLISRTGYTGEDGFEILVPTAATVGVWDALAQAETMVMDAGTGDGRTVRAVPCGLGCRDTLRFEAGMPLFGNELARDISPLEAGLDRFVRLDKAAFVGRDALADMKERGAPRRLTGFEMAGRGVARHGYPVWTSDGTRRIGFVTTGYHSPTLGVAAGSALVESEYAGAAGFSIEIRGNLVPARTRSRFFYKRKGR